MFLLFNLLLKGRMRIGTIIRFVLMLFLVFVINIVIFTFPVDYHAQVDALAQAKFDVMTGNISPVMYEKLTEDTNNKNIVGFGMSLPLNISLDKHDKHPIEVNFLKSSSLIDIVDFIVPKGLLIKKDMALMEEENALLMSIEVSQQLKANIGDEIHIDFDGESKSYVLAGIYGTSLYISFNNTKCIVKSDSFVESYLQEKYGNIEAYYMIVFLQFVNYNQGISMLKNENLSDWPLYDMYGKDYVQMAAEDEEVRIIVDKTFAKSTSYNDRRSDLDRLKSASLSHLIDYIALSIFCFLALLVLGIFDGVSRIRPRIKSIAISSACGLSKRKIFMFFMITTFLKNTVISLLAIAFIKFVIYRNNNPYFSPYVIFAIGPLILFIMLLVSLAISIGVIISINNKRMLTSLQEGKW